MTEPYDFNDEEQLVVRDGHGRIVVQAGLRAVFYFEGAEQPERRAAVVACVDKLQSLIGQHLRWVVHPTTAKRYPRGSPRVPALSDWMAQRSKDQAWEYCTHGGEQPEAASHFLIAAYGPAGWKGNPGYLEFALPLTWFADHPGSLPALVLEVSDILRPLHGYGGIGLLESFDESVESAAEPSVYALARRFPGLEVGMALSHARYLKDGIKGVNWLTLVGTRWLPAVGGVETLRAVLGADIPVREYNGGVLIQAGARPRLGDVNDGRSPEPYQRVAHALRPIRVDSVGSLHYAGANRFTKDTSDEWLRRFDVEP